MICSLLTHHLTDPQIVQFLQWMERTARRGWFVNDLHRKPVPYHFFRLLVRFTNWHPFVKNDGAVSIRRSFVVEDWQELCAAAGTCCGDSLDQGVPSGASLRGPDQIESTTRHKARFAVSLGDSLLIRLEAISCRFVALFLLFLPSFSPQTLQLRPSGSLAAFILSITGLH